MMQGKLQNKFLMIFFSVQGITMNVSLHVPKSTNYSSFYNQLVHHSVFIISPTADLKISCMLSLLIGSLEHMLKATEFRIYLSLFSQWISSTPSQHYQITCLEQFEWH